MPLLIGLFVVGFLLGRYLPPWMLVVAPFLLAAWGLAEAHAANNPSGLVGLVLMVLAGVFVAGELVGARERGIVRDETARRAGSLRRTRR